MHQLYASELISLVRYTAIAQAADPYTGLHFAHLS